MASSMTLLQKAFSNGRLQVMLTWLWVVICSFHAAKSSEVYSGTYIEDVMNASPGGTVLLSVESETLRAVLVSWIYKGQRGSKDIVDYHIGTSEAEIPVAYENRVIFSLHNFSLQLLNLTKNDSGQYIFKVDMSKVNRVIHLQVTDPLLGASVLKQSAAGDCTLMLYCKINGEASNITWKKNGDHLPEADMFVINKTTLIINGTGSALSGNYTCIAQNPINTVKADFALPQRDVPVKVIVSASSACMTLIFSLPALLIALLNNLATYLLRRGLKLSKWFFSACEISSNCALLTSVVGWISWCLFDLHYLPVVVFLSIVSLIRICSRIWQCQETLKYILLIWKILCHLLIFAFAVILMVLSAYHDLDCRTFGTMHFPVFIWSFSISLVILAIIIGGVYILSDIKRRGKNNMKSSAGNPCSHANPEGSTYCPVPILS
ncbi:uncharacterized protein LOC122795580 [Protopterus annectens]|uniref:uncharacterized protein LOC122795580 n=1 Tax=Protopterus annectens TaxID=7888 RepID=UPI001CFA9D9A|nr:uncharacterized protein LOC122795580 [Protopterus annectens]